MRFVNTALLAGLAIPVLGQATNYSLWMASSQLSRGQGIWTGLLGSSEYYQCGFTQRALRAILDQYGNGTNTSVYAQYLYRSVDSMVPPLSNASALTKASLDRFSNGINMISRYQETMNQSYQQTAQNLRTSLDLQPRNPEGSLWYYVYPGWVYLDGMYSLVPFYTLYTNVFQPTNTTARSDTVRQLDLIVQHCVDNATGLLVHGYDANKTAVWANNSTGASPYVWGRALGWYMMALLTTLDYLPTSEPSYSVVLAQLRRFAPLLVAAADPVTGGWWQILGYANRTGNYIESSSTSMFTYVLLKGVRVGYLNEATVGYRAAGRKAYTYLRDTAVINNGNGTLSWNNTVAVCSLNSTASYDYYIGRPIELNNILGSNAFILASLEYERLSA